MSFNKRNRYSFRLSTFQFLWFKKFAKKLGFETDHLIGKIIRRKIRIEKEKLKKEKNS